MEGFKAPTLWFARARKQPRSIGQLAAIVILRTVLNFFLQNEIDKAEAREQESARAP